MRLSLWKNRFYFKEDNAITFVKYIIAILYSLMILIPVYYVVIASFKTNAEIFLNPMALPESWSLEKFFVAEAQVKLIKAIGMSFVITIGAEALNLALGFMVAYAIARIPTRLATWVETIFSVGFLIPTFATLVPVYLLSTQVGLYHNPLSLIFFLSASRLPITTILLASHLRSIPKEMEESAEIDGANKLQMLLMIFLPLSSSGVITVFIINFLSFWNEFLFALILLSSDNRTVQVAVPLLRAEKNTDYALLAAGVTLSIIPVLIVFLIFQERIMSGMTAGAVKG